MTGRRRGGTGTVFTERWESEHCVSGGRDGRKRVVLPAGEEGFGFVGFFVSFSSTLAPALRLRFFSSLRDISNLFKEKSGG